MRLSFEFFLITAIVLIYINIIMIIGLILRRLKNSNRREAFLEKRHTLLTKIAQGKQRKKISFKAAEYLKIKQAIQVDELKKGEIDKVADQKKIIKKYTHALNSFSKVKRMEGAVYLGQIATNNCRHALEKRIIREKSYPVKLYMANAIFDIGSEKSIEVLIDTLSGSHYWYRNKVNILFAYYGKKFNDYIPRLLDDSRIEIKELILEFSSVYYSAETKTFLISTIDNMEGDLIKLEELYGVGNVKTCSNCVFGNECVEGNNRVCQYKGIVASSYVCSKYKVLPASINYKRNYQSMVYRAAEILSTIYPNVLNQNKYLENKDSEIRNYAVKALSNFNTPENVNRLLEFVRDENLSRSAVNSLSLIIERKPNYFNDLINVFIEEKDVNVKKRLGELLTTKIEYFIMRLGNRDNRIFKEIIKQILLLGKTSEVIEFLNKNNDIDIENELVKIIKEVSNETESLKVEFSKYLDKRILNKCKIEPFVNNNEGRKTEKDLRLISYLYKVLLLTLLSFPLLYIVRHYREIFIISSVQQIKTFIVDFNYYLAFYSLAINSVYIILLIFSNFNVKKQSKLWNIKSLSLLFKKRMLPSISIIAPAFNEERTIIESANSLLNLKYPDYELIIVNDGSKDKTLKTLIDYYGLSKIDYIYKARLNTRNVRGIYVNRSMPKLIVVDKENGGKADSLNTGINISSKEYFCGIDADSLLEEDALLRLASLTMDEGVETPALGGNILAINGCVVDRGQIKWVKLPQNTLARFQTIEYLRAFMAGRLGWAYINSLLIISGAFGLFRKERVISAGGYLTSSGKYAKDTVGEDMELVVRISRLMREAGHSYKISYAFNANCWTEVPEDVKSLKRQRTRWHSGLIDILSFHKKMLFNPKYGKLGMLALPYFFIFEMIGPIIEMLGYTMVFVAAVFGLINWEIALLLFTTTILMGIFISIFSLLIGEHDYEIFNLKDTLTLILYSIFENFGVRQLFSFWRVTGYIDMLKKPQGWGHIERKGFNS